MRDRCFVQPEGEASVLHNGTPITGSTWLRGGDVLDLGGGRLRLRAEDGRRVLEFVAAPSAMPRHRRSRVRSRPQAAPRRARRAHRARVVPQAGGRDGGRLRAGCRGAGSRSPRVSRCSRGRGARVHVVPVQVEIAPTGAARVRGQLGRLALRLQPPAPARRLHAVAEREGYGDVAGARRRSASARPAPELRARAGCPPPRGGAGGAGTVTIDGRVRAARRVLELPAGRHTVVIDTERTSTSPPTFAIEAAAGCRSSRRSSCRRGPRSRSPRSPPAPRCARRASCAVARRSRSSSWPVRTESSCGSAASKPWCERPAACRRTSRCGWVPCGSGVPDGRLAVRSSPGGRERHGRRRVSRAARPSRSTCGRTCRSSSECCAEGYEPARRELDVAGRAAVAESRSSRSGEVTVRAVRRCATVRGRRAAAARRPDLELPATAQRRRAAPSRAT